MLGTSWRHLVFSAGLSHYKTVARPKKVVRPPVTKHVKKHTKLGKRMSEIDKTIPDEICTDYSSIVLTALLKYLDHSKK